jgi:sulfide:quinone oxidoreductase
VTTEIVILGAGFGGLEVATRLSEEFGAGGDVHVTLIDKAQGFVFGFSKFDLVFGDKSLDDIRADYSHIAKPGVDFRQELITSVDPVAKRVVTDGGTYDADFLVVALGADYDFTRPEGFADAGYEFYSWDGALRLREALQTFPSGHAVIAVLGEPFKCPPAPCEGAMLLDEWLVARNRRGNVQITVVSPWGRPIPPSPDGSKQILDRFAERDITFMAGQLVTALDPPRKVAFLRDGGELAYGLFIGVPIHRAPAALEGSGLLENGWVAVDKGTLATRFDGVYAIGDVANAPVPRAGVFAENAGGVVAAQIIAKVRGQGEATPYDGRGTCYVEFGDQTVGRLDADFLTGPSPVAPFKERSLQMAEEKAQFARTRRRRWFGL